MPPGGTDCQRYNWLLKTMTKRNQHFVPQLYLRLFASDQDARRRQISLYQLESRKIVHCASIRQQCSRDWFYGKDEAFENELERLETEVARVLHEIRDSRQLPANDTGPFLKLLHFVALQGSRTSRVASEASEAERKFLEITFHGDRKAAEDFFGGPGPYRGLAVRMENAPMVAACYADLTAVLLRSPRHEVFVTSDHPVAIYNQFCEELGAGRGVTGAAVAGLQVLMPVTPELCLLLFDSDVYEIPPKRRSRLVTMSTQDLDQINLLQAVGAECNVYFPGRKYEATVLRPVSVADPHRALSGPRVTEAVSEDDPTSRLVHQYRALPNLRLRLTFLRLRPRAWRIKVSDRLHIYRPAAAHYLAELEAFRRHLTPPRIEEELRQGRSFRRVRTV